MSEDPSWKDFPKYNQSLILTNDSWDANSYGKLFQVIPYDNANIGICPEPSIWQSFGGFSQTSPIRRISNFLDEINIDIDMQHHWMLLKDDIKSIGVFHRDTKKQKQFDSDSNPGYYYEYFINNIENGESFVTADEVISEIEYLLSPDDFKVIKYDMNYDTNLGKLNIIGSKQFWTDSKSLLKLYD